MRIWGPAEHADGLRAALPADIELGLFEDAEFMVPSYGTAESLRFISTSSTLRVIQTLESGVDWLSDRVPEHVTLCNARGVRDTPVAEWVLAMLLAHGKGLFEAAERRTWKYWQPRELAGSTVLIVGHGSIGAALARRLDALDAHVVGVARTARDGLYGIESLPELLPSADSVVVLAPLTAQTRGFVDERFLARMRDGALLINAGRGQLADTDALLGEAGRLRFALDVTDPEPLPDGHPLWTAPGVVISPHMAGDSPESFVRAYELVADQLERFRAGQPLVNVIARPSAADR
jgi:phosphoglycerate dehydrogenase-like enzyme